MIWHEPDEVTDETFIEIAAHYLTHDDGVPYAARLIRAAARNNDEERYWESERIREAMDRIMHG